MDSQQSTAGPARANNAEAMQKEKQRREEQAEQMRVMLKAILTPEASERLANVRVVKPERAQQVEATLLQMYQQGRLPGPVNEAALKQLLDQYSQAATQTKVTISRRNNFDSDEEEDDDEDW
ncbi:DNA-binding protein [Porphyridium purpureum]|uniref:DNA-binding protein n=1 Tax=Porphyridium purpureum TaxID=35688 RepID=A0A5J4YIX7_PORPP|nr:DNA-binding protein [Porphyridium purpureum]|eukprot:POR6253..scf297_16